MNRVIIFFLLLLPVIAGAQHSGKWPTLYTLDSFKYPGNYPLDTGWKFMEADSPTMATLDYDDHLWKSVSSDLDYNHTSLKFNSVGWFRYPFITDSSLNNYQLALQIYHYGASEIYFDGQLIKSFGIIKGKDSSVYSNPQMVPILISAKTPGKHIIAVRYANYNAERNYKWLKINFRGFKVFLSSARVMIGLDRHQTILTSFIYILLFGIFIALALSHLFLYLYYKQLKSNLYFSLFSGSLAFIFMQVYISRLSTSPDIAQLSIVVDVIFIALACYALNGFTSLLFRTKKTRFPIVIVLCCAAPIIWFINPNAGIIAIITLLITVLIETIIVTVLAIYRKTPGARIIGTGILFFALFCITMIFLSFGGLNINEDSTAGQIFLFVTSCAILSIPVSFSLYLAWSFSNVNKNLLSQLDQVKYLSEKTLEQERETKKILESQNENLELEVARRTAEVVTQKELIEIKNKSITDNINYAQRIQSAILPDVKLIYKTLTDSFILFLPKDIVSGDFYMFSEKNGRVFIVAGDCTGHGVSGAFMSMIGSSLLNQIINEKGTLQPSLILQELNIAVIESLRQKENESHDGMDISICSFDLVNNELQYAGANRPLWLMRNGKLEVFSPDKFPIGGLQMARDRVFTNVTIQLQPQDTMYIFTDGYADQFGGPMGKKMMTAKFKEMLGNIQHLTMKEQEQHLTNFFNNWKGNNEQVDDVLVIGIRV